MRIAKQWLLRSELGPSVLHLLGTGYGACADASNLTVFSSGNMDSARPLQESLGKYHRNGGNRRSSEVQVHSSRSRLVLHLNCWHSELMIFESSRQKFPRWCRPYTCSRCWHAWSDGRIAAVGSENKLRNSSPGCKVPFLSKRQRGQSQEQGHPKSLRPVLPAPVNSGQHLLSHWSSKVML